MEPRTRASTLPAANRARKFRLFYLKNTIYVCMYIILGINMRARISIYKNFVKFNELANKLHHKELIYVN